ncbi:uncharacterized protein LOC123547250 [Mercenaria mercenaria]|uniref:uncharacterized protein LOC123547250 n=1 Tax=Mercenaria mercenaria TaxID=6596 RepID=UPI00234F32BF|nr:uncharacterized protein LOC123547250 [Mercenaria mercenaria]
MIRATEGCYGVNLNNFGTEGKRIIKLLEAENCTKNHMSQNCDIAGLNTLTSLIFSPYYTTESLESVCRLFDEVASEVISKFSEGKCCDVTAIETLITVYQHIHPHCRHLNIGPVCEVTVHLSCPSHSDKTSNTNRSKNSTIGDSSQFKNNGFISKLCSQFSSQSQRELNNQSESDVAVEKTGCDVSDIVSKCLGSFTGCSDTALEDLTLCVQNHTASCSAVQIVPVAMTFDRIAFSCGRDISRVPDYVSVEIEHQYHCLQELAKMNTASTPETPLKISLCKTMNSVSSCLVSSEIPGALVPKMYFNGVEGNVNRFKEFICTHDSAETEEENSGNGTCDIAAISETALHYINFALTSPPMIGNDACIFAMELETLRKNLTTCSGMHNHPLDGVLSWIQKEVKVTCDANLAAVMCQQSNCDVTMTTNLLKQLGYYLLVTNFNDMVFCKKVANVLHGVECLADSCREDMTSLHAEVLYIRSVVGTRCPDLTYYLHCSDGMMKGQQNNARNITNGDRIQKESVNETKNGVNGTGIAETCNVMQSKMCVNSVRLPAAVDGLYCSKMMSVMKQLSDCVLPKLRGCTSAELTDAVTHYQTLFTRRRQYCPTDFLTHLFGELMDGDHCEIPQCFTAADCYKHFKAKEEGNCGNLDDIEQCVFYATEGCNYFQQQASMITLQAFVVQEGLPKECLKSKLASMNTSTDKLIECVLDFNQQMSDILSGNMTGSPSCHLMTSYITCLETTLELADIPTVVKEPFNHLVLVAKPATEIVCKQKDDELSQEQKPRKEHGNETCGTEKGLYCLKKFSANVLLSPLFSYDGKQMICSHLSERSNCLADALSECSHDEITNPYYNVYSLIEMLSQLTGVCSPSPFTCSPEIAMECVSHLGYVLRARSYLEDVCFVLQQTELCIRQTTSSCDSFTKNSVLQLYEPIRCKAYSVCPSAIQISEDVSRETPESCIDPTEVVAHSGTCRPFVALRCLQDVNDAATGTTKDRNATCRNYESALTCFFNNLNACDDDVTIMMSMYYLLEVSNVMDKMCFTTIKHDCDSAEETECDLDQLEDCIEHFRGIEEFGTAKERCLARTDVKHCFEVTTRSCPKITRLYAKTRFLKNTLREADNKENMCDNVHQCIFNYMAYFNVTLSHQSRHLNGDNDQKNPETSLKTVSKQKHDPMKMYQCHARLDELSCIQSHLEMLPEDVAMVAGNLLMHMDNAFADVCAVQVGLLPDLQGCNQSCIKCLQNRIQMENDTLLTFVSDIMNASSNTPVFSSSKFCRLFEKLKASRNDSFNESCFDKQDDLVWHSRHMNDMANLYDKYCNRPCNTTQADICINQLESDISSLGKEGSCLSFNETLKCLEDSVTSCEANVTNQYFNQAETIFRNTGITCYIMPSFEVSYSSTELVMMEGEMSQQMSISVTMTRPVMDSCYGSSCHMEVFVSMEQVMAECSSGQEIPQILMDNCVYIFDVNNTASTHQFNFYPRVDHKVEDKRNVTVNVIGQLWEDGSLATGDVLATVTMVLEDRDSSGVCYLISEPTIKTFDNVLYYSFSQGEYILYQHDTLQEKVHVGFQRCRRSSVIPCPCVVMVQSGDDTFIIDRCRRSGELYHALEFKVYKNNDITEQTRVYTLTNRNFFQFVLPSGAIVNVRSGRFLLDVWIKPSALDFGHTSGLCGTYDGDRENDFTLPDASVEVLSDVLEWRGNFLPLTFVNSWRPENTLFGGVQESDNSLPSELLGTKCACTNLTCTPTDIVETCDFISGVDITADLELYTQIIEVQTRRRRQTENVWDNIDYDPENPTGQLPTWPTGSGLTEEGAIQTCESALRNHASWDICSVAVDTTSIVSSCVTDMLLSDTDEFVSEYVEDMKLQCKVAVLSDPSIASLLSQTQEELVSYLLTLTCLNDCSGRGQCVNDVCQCDAGYLGDDCSGSLDTAPAITSLSENIYSEVAGSGLTVISRQVVVYGSGFENSNNLTCHTKQVEVSDTGYRSADIVSSSRGTFLTSGTLLCEVFGSLPLTGLLLSVSNNGVNQSNGVMYIFQDPVCFDCDPDAETCNNQSTSCVIEGQCYAAGVYSPTDQCLLCDPVSNFWIFKPSSTCVTTSTSTTSSSTSSTSSTTSTTSSTSSSTISSTDSTSSSTSSTTSSTSPSTSSSSSTTSSSTSASSSTSPSTSVSSPTSPSPSTPSTTQPGQEGDKDEQDGDKEDTQTFNIVIITGACVVVLIVVVTAIFAYRLRRKDIRTSKAGSSVNSSEPPPRKQGQTNPGYSRGEAVRPIAGDPVIQPRRITPLYSAAFNTEGLEGRAGAPDIYEDDPGLHTVNIEIFDEGRGRSRERPTGERPVMYDPEYDNAGLERRYTIPRPYVAPQPAGIYPEVRRQGVDADYDNVTPERQGADKRESPMPDYYEADGADVTRM